MANYYLNSNGSLTTKKTNKKKNYILQDDGTLINQAEQEKKAKEQNAFFKSGSSDVGTGLAASTGDFLLDMGQGFFRTLEGISDTLQYGLSDLTGAIGMKDASNWLKENAKFNSTGSLFGINENVEDNIFSKELRNDINEASYLGGMSDSIGEGLGNIGAMAALSAVGGSAMGAAGVGVTEAGALTTGGKFALSFGNSYISAYGNARSEAYNNGASDEEANRFGIINGLAEGISEQFFDSMPGVKSAGFADKIGIKDFVANKLKTGLGTNVAKTFLKLAGGFEEGAEEMISNALVAVGQDIMHSIDNNYTYGMENLTGNVVEDFKKNFVSDDSIKSFISAGFTSAILGVGGDILTTAQTNQVVNAFAKDNNMSFKEAKTLLSGQTLNEAQQQVQREVKEGKGEVNNLIELDEAAKKRIVNFMKAHQGENIESRIEDLVQEEAKKKGVTYTPQELQQEANKIRATFIDQTNNPDRYMTFTQNKNETNNELAESFRKAKVNNTQQAHAMYNFVSKLQENNKNLKYQVVNNEILKEMGQSVKDATINGFNKDGTIYINMDAKNPYQAVAYHEIAHSIKDTSPELYNELKNLVFELKGKEGLAKYRELYRVNDNELASDLTENVEDEYINDQLGEILNDDKFIQRIENRNILQKLIDEIKRVVKYMTSSKDQKQLMKVQQRLEEVYKEGYQEAKFKVINKQKVAQTINENKTPQIKQDENVNQKKSTTNVPILSKNLREYLELKEKYDKGNIKVEDRSKVIEQLNQLEDKLTPEERNEIYKRESQNLNEDGKVQYSLKLRGYNPDIDLNSESELNQYSIKNLNNHDEVISKVTKKLKDTYLSTNELSKPITNIDTGMEIEIRQKGIRETFGKPEYYDKLPLNAKKAKIASISQLAKMIKYGEVRAAEASNYHNPNSKVTYAYLKHPITIDGQQYMVNMDIRRSPQGENRFYIHSLDIKKETDLSNSQSELLTDKSISTESISQNKGKVNYSLSQDSQGKELTKEQQEYFKDSKIRDAEGRLLEVYHGSKKAGFTTFETPDNVNFYTDSEKVANTYSGSNEFVDTKKLNNIEEAQQWLDDLDIGDLKIEKNNGQFDYQEEYIITQDGEPINVYSNEDELLKYLKRGIQIELGNTEAGGKYKGYVNITNPFVVDGKGKHWRKIPYNGESSSYGTATTNMIVDDILSSNKNNETNYDGIIFKNIIDEGMYDSGVKGETASNVYVTFDSNQFKATDNLNPTSNPDIRYSLSPTGEMVDNQTGEKVTLEATEEPIGTLMAIHNLNESKLNGILDLGGFPVPSIAITNPDIVNHKQFGDISVIFDKETINPENRLNEVFDRDVWSPTFPTIEYDLNTKTIDRVRKAIGGYGNNYLSSANSTMNNIEDKINRYGVEDTIKDLKDDNNFKYIYYKNMNPDFELLTKEETEDLSTDYSNRMLQEFADEYGEIPKWTEATDEQRKDIVDKFGQKLIPFLEERAKTIIDEEMAKPNPRQFIISIAQSNVDHIKERMGALGWQDKLLENLNRIQSEGTTRIVNDYKATSDFINQNINQQDYEKWIDDLFSDIVNKKGIYNGKEIFTASGNRRTFNQLHEDYNLQNLVKILTSQDTIAGEQGFGAGQGFGTIQAKQSNRFNTIQDIKDAENRITSNSNEVVDQLREVIGQDMEQLNDYQKIKSEYSYVDSAGTALNDFAAYKNLTMNNLNTALENNNINSKNVPVELKQKIIDDIESLKTIPTDYFEAKPQRAVGLDEIGAVVIPSNSSEEFKQRLRDNNIEFTEYNPEIEGDRNAKINEYEQYKFSLSQEQQEANNLLKVIESYDDYLKTLPSYQQLQERKSNLDYTDETHGILTKEDYKNKKIDLFNKQIEKADNKMEEQAKRFARENLELTRKAREQLQTIIDKYKGQSRETIFNSDAKNEIREFVKNNSRQEFVEELINEDVRDLQKAIRNTELVISKENGGEFADGITQFRKNNPGLKIKYGKQNIDSVYQELQQQYPGMLEEDVNDKDIPFILADFLKKPYRQFDNSNVQVFELNDKEIDNIANKIYKGLTNNAISDEQLNDMAKSISQKVEDKYARAMATEKYREIARDTIDITDIKDKKRGIQYKVNTMKRNLRDIMSKEQAQLWYDTYFKPITIHNAQSEIDKQSYVERIQKYNLNKDESTYTQMLGELKYNPETDLTSDYVNQYAATHKIDTQKCTEAVEEFRAIYDELIGRVNEALKANGYKEIDYRKGYFPHFIEDKPKSIIGKFADKLGWNVQKGTLPTDIAGITDQFKPGKAWTSFSQQRTGDTTDYNALKGMDNYLRGAMDLIYHTEDIQKLRALENEIRYQYSSEGVQKQIDEIYANKELSPEEKSQQISLLTENQRDNPLGNLVTELRDYTNALANKKSILDRGMEQALGRDWYSIMNNINGRVSANMVGANISSAMTNFIPITQAWSQVSTKNLMRGMYESIKNTFKNDGFDQNSVYLTNRTKQADNLYNSGLDRINQKLGIIFEGVDSFTSNTIVRAKYYENLEKGMSEQAAMSNADEFAKDVMAGRSKGDSPTIFNTKNPLYKMFTAFQLEVNNQYGYLFKDLPADLGDEAKDKLAMAVMKMFLGAWLYNLIGEKITGRKAAFSPIDMIYDEYKVATNENLDFSAKVSNIAKDITEEAPFIGGIMGGGRLPIQGAIPYENPLSMVLSTAEDFSNAMGDDEGKKKTAINNLKKEWMKPVYYLALPFAGGQIKKTAEGLAMYDKNLPVAGSYTAAGKLRFEADTSPLGIAQAAVFGQYASGNAREYFDKGYTPLTENQINEALDANLPINEYREVNKGINEAKKTAKENGDSQTEAQYNYIYNLPISMEQKNSLINSKLKTSDEVTDDNGYIKYTDGTKTYWYDKDNNVVYNSKYRVIPNIKVSDLTKYSNVKDISNYGDYGSLAEFNYAVGNPTKYSVIQQITDYDSYMRYKDDIAAIKDSYDTSNERKSAVFNYINSLNLNMYQKLMLQKMAANYSIKSYRSQMHNYIDSLNLTAEEKQQIDDELFG